MIIIISRLDGTIHGIWGSFDDHKTTTIYWNVPCSVVNNMTYCQLYLFYLTNDMAYVLFSLIPG